MDIITNDSVHLTLSEFSAELHRTELEDALQRDSLRSLFLHLDDYDGVTNLDVFLRALKNAPEDVVLLGIPTTPDNIDQFMNAIARNTNIKVFYLKDLIFPAASLTSLLRVTDSVRLLALSNCGVREAPGSWENDFAKALNENEVIRTLDMKSLDVAYMKPVVEQLGSHPNLKRLRLSGKLPEGERGPLSLATSNVIRYLLENGTSSSLRIECKHFDFDGENFLPIARGAIDGRLDKGLSFFDCSFNEASTDLFESMFRPGSNLRSLGLACDSVFAKSMNTMVSEILRPNSPLQTLSVRRLTHPEGGSLVASIMKQLEVNTTLRHLSIDNVGGEVREALQNGLPKLRGLHKLSCFNLRLDDAQRPAMMDAFKRNGSIRKTSGAVLEAFPDEEDKKKLRFYATRNKNIPVLLENPARIPLSAWPKVFKMSQQCEFGANTVFRALVELEERVGQPKRSRKRRRLN